MRFYFYCFFLFVWAGCSPNNVHVDDSLFLKNGGFVSGVLASLMGTAGTIAWISAARTLFPPALKSFGLQPDRCIFIDLQKEKDVCWAMEEALKCSALSAVVGELRKRQRSARGGLRVRRRRDAEQLLAIRHEHVLGAQPRQVRQA